MTVAMIDRITIYINDVEFENRRPGGFVRGLQQLEVLVGQLVGVQTGAQGVRAPLVPGVRAVRERTRGVGAGLVGRRLRAVRREKDF